MEQIDKNTKMFQLGTIIGKTILYAAFIIESILAIWLFMPIPPIWKIVTVFIGMMVSYNIYRSFINVEWVLWKQDLETMPSEELENHPDTLLSDK